MKYIDRVRADFGGNNDTRRPHCRRWEVTTYALQTHVFAATAITTASTSHIAHTTQQWQENQDHLHGRRMDVYCTNGQQQALCFSTHQYYIYIYIHTEVKWLLCNSINKRFPLLLCFKWTRIKQKLTDQHLPAVTGHTHLYYKPRHNGSPR